MATGSESNPRADESSKIGMFTEESFDRHFHADSIQHHDFPKSISLAWAADVKEAEETEEGDVAFPPPVYLILYPDLLEDAWGWDRLVPYSDDSINLSEFKKYLEDYFLKNANQIAILCNCRSSEPIGEGSTDVLQAAHLCIKMESMFIRRCFKFLTLEDIKLSGQIKEHARRILVLEGRVSSIAAAALVCVMKEAELMCKSVEHQFETTQIITLSNMIRHSASIFMQYTETESGNGAASAAMLGISKEAVYIHDLLSQDDSDMYEYWKSDEIRRCTATVLNLLERESGSESDSSAGVNGSPTSYTSEMCTGFSTVSDSNGEESGLVQNSKGDFTALCKEQLGGYEV